MQDSSNFWQAKPAMSQVKKLFTSAVAFLCFGTASLATGVSEKSPKPNSDQKTTRQADATPEGVDCYDLRFKTLQIGADGGISADGVELRCNGQSVELVDGTVRSGVLETKAFGSFVVKRTFTVLVFVTPEQNKSLRKYFGPRADLVSASEFGDISRVKLLLSEKGNLEAKDYEGMTALCRASSGGYIGVVEILIRAGANVNAICTANTTPLIQVKSWEDLKKSKALLQALLGAGADVNRGDSYGRTPLMNFAIDGRRELVQLLIASGASVNARDASGSTALMLSAGRGKREAVESLLEAGADVNAMNMSGETPLAKAIKEGFVDVANVLRQHGAK